MSTCRANTACRPATAITTCTTGWLGSSGFRRTRYELLLEPQLARLELCCNWRIFQEKSVPEILQALLKEHRVLDYEQRIYHEHLPREYCVQAGDSDHYLHDRLATTALRYLRRPQAECEARKIAPRRASIYT
ncbi:contractile injection system protein, VgrG/Pvc8 family [Pseudomonas aeruginosa]